jgi:pre-mRNA-processing factor 6
MSRAAEMRGVGVGPRSVATTYAGSSVPSNYVAGLGRGAIGFTTRSDIGPARTPAAPGAPGAAPAAPGVGGPTDFGAAPAGYIAGRGRGMGDLARVNGEGAGRGRGAPDKASGPADRMDYSESNYDEFSGYQERLFGDTPYDEADEEADRVYEAVDEHLEARRKRRREQSLEDMKKAREDRPKISDQFADLKSKLGDMSQEMWESIPDIGDYSLKHKQVKRKEVFTPMPDHVIESSRGESQTVNALDPTAGAASMMPGGMSSINGLAEARGKVLGLNLDRMSDSVSGQTVVDPKGYLTDLNSLKVNSDAEVGDIEKARLLLRSVTSTNPKHGPGWIAAARLEEYAGKLVAARKTIKQGCEICPDNEDVWLEASRLQTPDNARSVLANAVRHLPGSVKVSRKVSNQLLCRNVPTVIELI